MGFLDSIGDFLGDNAGDLLGAGLSLAGSFMSSSAKEDEDEAKYDAWLKWAQMMKPTEEEKQLMRERGGARLKRQALASTKSLSSSLASRGLGGGMLASGIAQNQRDLNANLGELEGQIESIGFGNYPSTPPPTTMSSGSYTMGNLGEMAQYLGGLTLSNSLFGKD